jgi:hypothetical protein
MSRGESYIFRHACGCAFGLADVVHEVTSDEQAWTHMYDTAAERDHARSLGVYVTREAWEDYRHTVYDQLRTTCAHQAATS